MRIDAESVITDNKEVHIEAQYGFDGKIKDVELPTWRCKKCNIDNKGVICSECKTWYNQADPDCELK